MIIFDTILSWLMILVFCLTVLAVLAMIAYVLIHDRRDGPARPEKERGRWEETATGEDFGWEILGDREANGDE